MAKPIRRSLARRLGRNMGDRRRAIGMTQEQLAEYLEMDTLTISRYETGNILPPLTVVDMVARLLHTSMASLLAEEPLPVLEHSEHLGILLSGLSLDDRDWVVAMVQHLVAKCQPRKRGRPRMKALAPLLSDAALEAVELDNTTT